MLCSVRSEMDHDIIGLYYIHMHILFRPWILQGLLYRWTEQSVLPKSTWGRKIGLLILIKKTVLNLLFCLMIWLLWLKIMFLVSCNNWMFAIIRPYFLPRVDIFSKKIADCSVHLYSRIPWILKCLHTKGWFSSTCYYCHIT